jgi:ribonuclease M5
MIGLLLYITLLILLDYKYLSNVIYMLQCTNRIKGGFMLKQVIVVEGKSDIQRIAQAVEADCIATEGFILRKGVIDMIRVAYEKRGIIILTDPDTAGERIRRVLTKKFPNAQHAFVPRDEAFANDDIGIEQASPDSIRKALSTLHVESLESSNEFTMVDLVRHGLSGMPGSAARRAVIGAKLGIGYGNGKQFLYRLNHYGITRDAYEEAVNC